MIGGNIILGAVVLIGNMQETAKAEVAAAEKRKSGKISRPMLDGVFCRTTVFNNKTGAMAESTTNWADPFQGAQMGMGRRTWLAPSGGYR